MSVLVCRTCLYVNRDIQAYKTIDKVKDILKLIVPEINYFGSSVVCLQCYYFLKNVQNFKTKCTEVERQLITYNFEQIRSASDASNPVSKPIKKRGRPKTKSNTDCPKPVVKEKKPRKPYARRHTKENKYDQVIPVSKSEVVYNRQPQVGPVKYGEQIRYQENNAQTPASYLSSDHVALNTLLVDPLRCIQEPNKCHSSFNEYKEPSNCTSYHNSPINYKVPVIKSNSILNYNKRSQELIDKLSEGVNKIQESKTCTGNEVIFDLSDLISSSLDKQLTEKVPPHEVQEPNSAGQIVSQLPESSEKVSNNNTTNNINIIEIPSDSEVELNDFSAICQENMEDEEDDIFEEDKITIVKNEIEEEDNPSFFNRQSDGGLYNCKLCSKKYKSSKGLYEHTQMKHNELKFYHCEICNFFTLWKSALMRHIDFFHNINEVNTLEYLFCYHCSYRTTSKDVLGKHITNMHFNNNTTMVL